MVDDILVADGSQCDGVCAGCGPGGARLREEPSQAQPHLREQAEQNRS